MLEAALYDLDGLIVNTEPIHGEASEKALNVFGHTLGDIPENVRKSVYGKRVVDVAAEFIGCLNLPVSPECWAEKRLEIFMQLIEDGIELMPGMEDSLRFFSSHGLKKAVVSSGDRRYVHRILEMTGLEGVFGEVIAGDDVTAGKPEPQCYLLAARRLGVSPPSRCLVLEDAYAGICAARAAGMKVIGIENLFNDNFKGADLVLKSLTEIDEKVLKRLGKSKSIESTAVL
ncbi:MAG: HAD family phosphatase [Gemmatimonadota bacterium]|nr:HAD family phosphatase [Gemmatimonadota bacterium]